MPQNLKITIAGGGIGGLSLALTLHRAGFAPVIYERSDEIAELGVGINILPHAIKQLADLGLLEALDGIGIRTKELIYKTALGQDILRQPRGTWAGYDVPQFSIHRGKLQKCLADAVVDRLGPDAIRTGHKLVAFDQDDGGVTASFSTDAGPVKVSSDILIGADGIHSTVRKSWHPDQGAPSWQGIVMWRGARWTKPLLDGQTMIIAGGMRAKLVLYPIYNDPARPQETLMNWVICANVATGKDALPHPDDWSRRGDLDEVMRHVTGKLHVPELNLEALIQGTDDIYVYPMCDRDPLDQWTHGRVTLLGDAAHPMYPVGSNGASQAILDAVSMAGHLQAKGVAGLMDYDAERRVATADIVRTNRKGGPERVIDLIEDRAPEGFTQLDDVATPDELRAIVGDYQTMAGFRPDQVNRT
jgi:2-polyprenyl-6-methoxyphenol hydroxylase-like FAD-dependent oxidoreductase